MGQAGAAVNCSVASAHPPSPAQRAFLNADYDKAADLYRAELASQANDPDLTAELVRVLLRQQKAKEAADLVAAALTVHPKSAVLLEAKTEAEYREGLPWDAAQTVVAASNADPCLARVHLSYARIARLNSRYSMVRSEIQLAHRLDPYDPDIWGEWIGTLSAAERVTELEKYLATPTGEDAEERHRTQLYLDSSKKWLREPHKACRLNSTVTSTEIPFATLMYDGTHIRAYGLDVKVNQKKARLQIDTGAGGLTISRSVAEHAGLKPYSQTEIGGVGDHGERAAYRAFAESIQIGNLEFHDCAVEVVDNKNMLDIDGLIGMDVFSKFLVTLNYPERKLTLSSLPARPGEAVTAPSLATEPDDNGAGSTEKTVTPAEGTQGAGEQAAGEQAGAKAKTSAAKGPYDRYIAPEMQDYTPVYRVGHLLLMPVSLNQSKLKLFILDTGAWATSIAPAAAREVTKVYSDSSLRVRGLNGLVEKGYSADEITFAFAKTAQKIQGVPSFDISNVSKHTGLEISGFLGAQTLRLLTIHIDYRDALVKFDYDPNKTGTLNRF
jgi:predicted aspartyl protease